MRSAALMRLDTVSWKITTGVAAACVAWVIISFIIAVSGPSRLHRDITFAYECPGGSHVWSPACNGSQMGIGQPSPWIQVQTGLIDKAWHLVIQPLEKEIQGLEGRIKTWTELEARSSSHPSLPWVPLVANRSKEMPVLCAGYGMTCFSTLLFWENNPAYDQYRVKLQFEHNAYLARYIGDVAFEAVTTPDHYARIALGFKYSYLIVSFGLTLFWFVYMLLFRKIPISAWTWEQRYMTVLLVTLNLYNNPFYGAQFAVSNAFFPFFNSVCELIFVGFAVLLWLIHIRRFRRAVRYENYLLDTQPEAAAPETTAEPLPTGADDTDDGIAGSGRSSPAHSAPEVPPPRPERAFYDEEVSLLRPVVVEPVADDDPLFVGASPLYFAATLSYVLLTAGLFLWSALRDRMTPVMTMGSYPVGFQLLYYASSTLYTFLVLFLAIQLAFNALGSRRHKDLLWGRYVFFAGPTIVVAFSLVLGFFTSNVGPYGSNMVGLLCYSAFFNLYVYFALWAYWPIESSSRNKESAGSSDNFGSSASYSSNL